MSDTPERVAEQAFFLDEFRHRTLLIALGTLDGAAEAALTHLLDTVAILQDNGSRVVLIGASDGPITPEALANALDTTVVASIDPLDPRSLDDLAALWIELSDRGVVVADVAAGLDGVGLHAAQLAVRLRADKLVLTDGGGGWGDPTHSFVDFADEADRNDDHRPGLAAAVQRALDGEVSSVNLCRLEDLGAELFTFDGAGTLFTRGAYLQVSALSLDDLPMVEELVGRGVAEGFLRPRPRIDVVKIAMNGLGARVARSGHLAAIGSLETLPYLADGVGEVTCLYTVNRFTGEGAAGQLLEGLVARALDAQLDAVFACTVSARAAAFFERHGFQETDQDHVPAVKWEAYDPLRRSEIRVLWLDLGGRP